MMSTTENSAPVTVDGLEFSLSGDAATLVHCDPSLPQVRVPETVDGRNVTVVGTQAFRGCRQLREVELPPNMEVVEAGAFEGCTALERVFLPYRLKTIEARAFADCPQLQEVPHFVWTGPKSDGRLLRNHVETSLPVTVRGIGEAAFAGCRSLTHMAVPHRVKVLPEAVFEGCAALETAWLHNSLMAIGTRAFADCQNLTRLCVPASVVEIGTHAFSPDTLIIAPERSDAAAYAEAHGIATRAGYLPENPIVSALGAEEDGLSVSEVLQSETLIEGFLDKYELRPPVAEIRREETHRNATPIRPSRFHRENGVYRSQRASTTGDTVTITMVGDLMCGFRQQKAALRDGAYDFSGSFEYVKSIFEKSDLALGNLETMVSESYPYMRESLYTDDRPHLNAPFAYLAAVRDAGFDAVLCAQNHMFDAGPKGVLETLDAINQAGLVHGGMFADPREPRHLIFEVKGIRIGVVAYLDPARQLMKQANFAPEAITAMASHFDEDRIAEDIAAARADGAEFILAYCHWGQEFTHEISPSQTRYAQMVADAGADYIFGSHSHNPQHYTVVQAEDGRRVPVVYSGGNFVSDITRRKPITQDSLISSLVLTRDASGKVVMQDDGYLPCRILESRHRRGYTVTVPLGQLMDGALDYSPKRAAEDSRRIAQTMGENYRTLPVTDAPTPRSGTSAGRPPLPFGPAALSSPTFAVQDPEGRPANTYDLSAYVGLPKMGEANQVLQELALGYGLSTLRTGWKDFSAWDSSERRVAFGIAYSESLSQMPEVIAGNKQLTRQFLQDAGVPVPRGRTFHVDEVEAALDYAGEIGYPVVVKPVGGKSGRGVTAGITDEHGVKWAVEQIFTGARRRGRFILEEHIPGQDYRIYVAYGEVLSVVVRKPAFVMGDGTSTVTELVEAKNTIRRQNPHTRARLMKKNASSTYRLTKQGLNWGDVPTQGTEVVLAAAANISQGGDSTDVTAETHPSILEAAINAAATFPGLEQAGVDFLLADHRRDVTEQHGGICEINTIPALMANQAPVFGEIQPVADTVFRAAAAADHVDLSDYQPHIRVSLRARGVSDPAGLTRRLGTYARRLGLGGKVHETGSTYVRADVAGPPDRVGALISSMFTGRLDRWPDRVRSVPTTRRVPVSFVEDVV